MPITSQNQLTTLSMAEDMTNASRGGVLVEDRRFAQRVQKRLTAHVVGFASAADRTLACPVADISEGGLFLCVPGDAKVTVGQRCEVVLKPQSAPGDSPDCAGEPVFATVVRTAPVSQGTAKLIGAGLRFDQPIYL
jgi:hypothetical protein